MIEGAKGRRKDRVRKEEKKVMKSLAHTRSANDQGKTAEKENKKPTRKQIEGPKSALRLRNDEF